MKTHKQLKDGINVARYTYDAWKKTFPNAQKKEWELVNLPYQTKYMMRRCIDYMSESMDFQKELSSKANIRIAMMDDEFFDYLKENNLENTEEVRVGYASNLSNEDCERLLKKHNMDIEYLPMCLHIPIFITNPTKEINVNVNENIRNELKKYLESIYKNEVFVANKIVKIDTFYNEYNSLNKAAENYFKTGSDMIPLNFTMAATLGKQTSLAHMCLPFVVKTKAKAIRKIVDFTTDFVKNEDCLELIVFDEDSFIDFGIKGVENFENTKVFEDLSMLVNNENFYTGICSAPIYVYDIPGVVEEFNKLLR